MEAQATLLNYWNVNAVLHFLRPAFDDRLTRGGPSVRRPGEQDYGLGIQSDSRKRISLGVNGNFGRPDVGGFSSDYAVSVALKPSSSLTLSTGPEISLNHTIAQYVTTTPDPLAVSTFGNRYVFADLSEPQVSMTTRINYIFTPKMSLQMYIQPLLTTGNTVTSTNWRARAHSIFSDTALTQAPWRTTQASKPIPSIPMVPGRRRLSRLLIPISTSRPCKSMRFFVGNGAWVLLYFSSGLRSGRTILTPATSRSDAMPHLCSRRIPTTSSP